MLDNKEWMMKSGFCDRLRKAREDAGLTMNQVAAQLETVLEYVHKVENGKTCPSIARVYEMAELYGISIDWLVWGERHANK